MIYIMSGGRSSSPTVAEIQVNYPQGSIVTCTDGTTILALEDNSGTGTFKVPNLGTWTVTATQDLNIKSEEVEITTKGQVVSITINYFEAYIKVTVKGAPGSTNLSCSDGINAYNYTLSVNGTYQFTVYNSGTWTITGVKNGASKNSSINVTTNGAIYTVALNFELILFNNGVYANETGGFSGVSGNNLYSYSRRQENGVQEYGTWTTNNSINMKEFTTLHFIVSGGAYGVGDVDQYNAACVKVGISSSKNSTSFIASTNVTNGSFQEYTVNITNNNDSYYIVGFTNGGDWTSVVKVTTCYISKLWLS